MTEKPGGAPRAGSLLSRRKGLAADAGPWAADFADGRFVTAPYADTPVDLASPDALWRQPSLGKTWDWRMHGLLWLLTLHEAHTETPDAGYDAMAETFARSWVEGPGQQVGQVPAWGLHQTALRAQVFTWLRGTKGMTWLDGTLRTHGEFLAEEENFSGPFNHGVDEVLAVLAIGAALGDEALVDVGEERARRVFRELLDDEGVTNEQAVGYQEYSHTVQSRMRRALEGCGRPLPELAEAVDRMGRFMTHCIQPDGRWVPIGDTNGVPTPTPPVLDDREALIYATTNGARGEKPSDSVAVFRRGFVFGRSGWGSATKGFKSELFYSLRFGEPRKWHGHRDHMALTLHDVGRDVLTEAGFSTYDDKVRRSYEMSEFAHNMVTWTGQGRYRWDGFCDLTAHSVTGRGLGEEHAYVLEDSPYAAATRRRSVLVMPRRGFVLVVDDLKSERKGLVQQQWHLAPGFRVAVAGRRVTATDATGQVTMLQLLPFEAVTVDVGQTEPLSGWYARGVGDSVPAPKVTFARSGFSARFVTAISTRSWLGRGTWVRDRGVMRVGHGLLGIQLGPDGILSTSHVPGSRRLVRGVTSLSERRAGGARR